MSKKRYTKSFSNFDGELQFASTVDLVHWCNSIKELAIEKLNDEG